MVTKYVCGRDWETPHVVELKFDEEGDLLVAPIGHRKKTRYHLGGHYFTHKSDSTLSDTPNEAIDKVIAHLRVKIKPTIDRINALSMLKEIEPYKPSIDPHVTMHDLERASTHHIDLSEYDRRQEELNQASFDGLHRD
jgi:hypothetical protein